MVIYVFGNPDYAPDATALALIPALSPKLPQVEFVTVAIGQDLPFVGEPHPVILDVVDGIQDITIFTEKDLDQLVSPPRFSVHDFDLAFQLKLLKKLHQLEQFTVIGLPMNQKINITKLINLIKKFPPS